MQQVHTIGLRRAVACWFGVFGCWTALFAATGALTGVGVGDELHYMKAASLFREQGWSALSEGVRPPGMPLMVAVVQEVVPEAWVLFATRCINLALSSLIPAVWVGASPLLRPRRMGLWMGALSAVWLPFHLLSSLAIAEAMSFLLLNGAALALLLREGSNDTRRNQRQAAVVGLLLALATLMKANIILVLPVFVLLVGRFSGSRPSWDWRPPLVAAVTAVLVLLPWVALVGARTGTPALANTNGTNLLLGSGYFSFGGIKPNERTLMARFEALLHHGASPVLTHDQYAALADDCEGVTDSGAVTLRCERAALTVARDLWLSRPLELCGLGVAKVLHSLGLSLRGVGDLFRLAVAMAGVVLPLLLWRSGHYRGRVFLHFGVVAAGLAIAFLWLPNQRFAVLYIDTTLLIVAATWLAVRLDTAEEVAQPGGPSSLGEA